MSITATPVDNGVNVEALLGARAAFDGHPGDRPVPMAINGHVEERHLQPLGRRELLRLRRRAARTITRSVLTPTTRCSSRRRTAAPPRSSTCLSASAPASPPASPLSPSSVRSSCARSSATLSADMDLHGILGADPEVRNGFSGVSVAYTIDADATADEIRAVVAQSQKRSAVYDIVTNPTDVTVTVV